jgi:uncharacterized protein YjaZ
MKLSHLRSDVIYNKIADAPAEKKDDIFRYEMMKPFEQKWAYYSIPLKAPQKNGYDVVMACEMLGFLHPQNVTAETKSSIALLSDADLWHSCEESVAKSLFCFAKCGIELPVEEYLYTILLANPESPYIALSDGYSGDGGIPGYIFASLTPNTYTMKRLPVALAHECNHNVRFQFIQWRNDITLGEMMVSEGLAECFAVHLFGEEYAGPWVTKTDDETLREYVIPLIKDVLDVQGLENLTPYLYGDEIAKAQGYFEVGMPYCAGYACGYHMIKHFLRKTGKSIVEATILPAKEIMQELNDFWQG